MTNTRLARIALGLLSEPGNRELGVLTQAAGPITALARVVSGQVRPRLRDLAATRLAGRDPYRLAEAALDRAERLGARLITPADPEWPARLEDLVAISQEGGRPIDRDTMPTVCRHSRLTAGRSLGRLTGPVSLRSDNAK